jgi:molybdopterin-guanine dinucleotide biosynthesis protein A
MGVDKAGLMFRGRPLVELAVEKLSLICADVAIVGNRTDLAHVAPVVTETRVDVGPGAGIEAGLLSARQDWCLFMPVDVPLLPVELLRDWAAEVLAAEREGVRGSYLSANERRQPSICLLHRSCLRSITEALDRGERKLAFLFQGIEAELGAGAVSERDAGVFIPDAAAEDLERWFANLNTPEEFAAAENFRGSDEE